MLSDVVSELNEYPKPCHGAFDDRLPGGACPPCPCTCQGAIDNIRDLYPDEALARLT